MVDVSMDKSTQQVNPQQTMFDTAIIDMLASSSKCYLESIWKTEGFVFF